MNTRNLSKKNVLFSLILLTFLIFSFLFLFFNKKEIKAKRNSKDENKVSLITTFAPVHIIVNSLVNGIESSKVSCVNITQNVGGCIHDYSLTTNDMKLIENADAVIFNGLGMEDFIKEISEKFPKIKKIDSSNCIEFIKHSKNKKCDNHKCKHCKEHSKECDECENCNEFDHIPHDENLGSFDPHIWLSVLNFKKQMDNISTELIKILPDYIDIIDNNRSKYEKKLDELEKFGHEMLDKIKNKEILLFSSSFYYLLRDYGFKIPVKINISHDNNLSAKKISKIIDYIKKNKTKKIFIEKNKSNNIKKLEPILNETSVPICELNSITYLEDPKDCIDFYIEKMKENFKNISENL